MTRNPPNRQPRRVLAGLLLAWVTCLAAGASSAEEVPPGPAVQVLMLDGQPVAGELADLSGGVVRIVAPTAAYNLPLGEVVTLRLVSPVRPALSGTAHLRLTLVGGEVLVGRMVGSTEDGIVLESPALGHVELLFDVIRTLVPVPADADPCYEPERRRAAADDDVAYVASGDATAGIVVSGSEAGFVIETRRGRKRTVDLSDLLVLHLANEKMESGNDLQVEVETIDGSRLVATGDLSVAEGRLELALRSLPGKKVSMDLARVRVLRSRGGAFVYASDLPFESEFVPYYRDETAEAAFLERWYAVRADRRPSGCPLRLDGRTYRHGFAVHSRSRIRLALNGAYARFQTLFGVDDEALERAVGGVVDARILADGEVVWSTEEVRAGTAPRRVGPLDVSEVETLVLEVDYGAELHFRDRASWADPILVRKQ